MNPGTLTWKGQPFTIGCSAYGEESPLHADSPKIFVRVRLGDSPFETTALLDTGSAFSVIHRTEAEQFNFSRDTLQVQNLLTPFGRLQGELRRGVVTLVAEEGESLELDALWLVSETWFPGRVVLGYQGLLHHIRFALDPEACLFHFGPLG